MKKNIIAFFVLLGLSVPSFAAAPTAPPINFATATFSPGGESWPSFNNNPPGIDNTSFDGIAISGYTYSSSGSTYRQDQGFLWLRNNSGDHGLGYCSEKNLSPGCGATYTTGDGDRNELSNNNKNEILRLTLPTGKKWADIWVSSLDDGGGTDGNEAGTLYWSNSATPTLSGGIVFSHDAQFHGLSGDPVEGSIFAHLFANGLDVNAKYLFFRAGVYNASGARLSDQNNDYLVWGVGVAPIPEPEIYAMLAAGLGLMGFVARRR